MSDQLRPALRRDAAIAVGAVIWHGGRPLAVFRVHGEDAAAPVILEELTTRCGLRGQLCLWSLDAVTKAMMRGASRQHRFLETTEGRT
ncbi:hypothetical protein [Rhodoplanes roseus]|uniref:Uncharacterized protein n=1 Tax=Rhodoplanes roseus TaxID=29409 RepID=A0A327L5G9_9BRAD|nr:hypothetical protein [Rhodoplanes roseus]RAI45275.1 hypothetical protein CH341_05005 [Rhodoplanes roseus]